MGFFFFFNFSKFWIDQCGRKKVQAKQPIEERCSTQRIRPSARISLLHSTPLEPWQLRSIGETPRLGRSVSELCGTASDSSNSSFCALGTTAWHPWLFSSLITPTHPSRPSTGVISKNINCYDHPHFLRTLKNSELIILGSYPYSYPCMTYKFVGSDYKIVTE